MSLSVDGLECRFGPTHALRGVSLTVAPGEVVALLGENGAGKSTLIKILAGVVRPSAGTVRVSGELAFVHQDLGLVDELSVAENIALVAGFERRRGGLIAWRRQRARAAALLERWEIHVDPAAPVRRLEAAERALVAIARAMATDARTVVLDEPTASLPRHEVDLLYDAIDRLRAGGVGVLYVTHRLGEVTRLADRAVVLRDGALVGTVTVADTSEERLVEMIVGAAPRAKARGGAPGRPRRAGSDPPRVAEDPALALRSLAAPGVHDATLDVRRGEILALVGLIGAGQRTVGRLVAGAERPREGHMTLRGASFAPRSTRDAQARGVMYLPSDRLAQAAFPTWETAGNLAARGGPVVRLRRRRAERAAAAGILRDWGVVPAAPDAVFATLSGGNQQKALLAKWVAPGPAVLVADEPTAGVDVGAKAAIHARLAGAARAGASVLLISSDAEEVVAVADRAVVFRDGSPRCELHGGELSLDRIALESYGG